MRTIEIHLQKCINRIEDRATNNGFKFPKSKTQCIHFCKLRRIHNDPVLYLYGSPVAVVEHSKFLRVIFDPKLSFIPHIRYIKAKCLKALNLMNVLSDTSWGADRATLLYLYRSLIVKVRLWIYCVRFCQKVLFCSSSGTSLSSGSFSDFYK